MSLRTCKALVMGVSLACLGVLGCTNLTVEPKSTVTEANIFTDVSSYRAFLAKIYAGLAVGGQQGGDGQTDIQGIDGGFSQYIRLYWEHEELPTDEAIIAWGDQGLPEMNSQSWAVTNSFVAAMYYRIYFQVGLANEFLRQTTDDKLAARGQTSAAFKSTIATYRAEARFLRALSYWHGLDLFGNIPLVTDADALGATPPPQATRQQLYDFVVSELTTIQSQLPTPGPDSYGRATGPAANILLANLYLNAGVYTGTANYAAALTAAQAVIGGPYTIDPSYRHLFQADNNTSPEIIFAVPEDGLRTQTYGSTNFLIHASCGGSLNPSDYGVDGCWYGLRLKPQAYNNYSAGDGRTSFFSPGGGTGVAVTTMGSFDDGIKAPKYSNRTSAGAIGSNPGFVDTDFPMFRLGEAYLIYAEAAVRTNTNLAQALTYVNALRQRAYGNTSGNIAAGALTTDFILAERGRELLWEGHRRTDLVRFGKFTGGSYLWAWKGNILAGTSTDAKYNLYPIPSNELSANPNLKQNAGY